MNLNKEKRITNKTDAEILRLEIVKQYGASFFTFQGITLKKGDEIEVVQSNKLDKAFKIELMLSSAMVPVNFEHFLLDEDEEVRYVAAQTTKDPAFITYLPNYEESSLRVKLACVQNPYIQLKTFIKLMEDDNVKKAYYEAEIESKEKIK